MTYKSIFLLALLVLTFFSGLSQELAISMSTDKAKEVYDLLSKSRKLDKIEGIWLNQYKARCTFPGKERGDWSDKHFQIAIIKKYNRYVCYLFEDGYIRFNFPELTFNNTAGENIYLYRYYYTETLGCTLVEKSTRIVNNYFETEQSTDCDPKGLNTPFTIELKMIFQKLYPE